MGRGNIFKQYVLGQAMMLNRAGSKALQEVLNSEIPKIENGKTANRSVEYSTVDDIAIIAVDGGMYKKNMNAQCMSIASYDTMIEYIDLAEKDDKVNTILFRVDTPGGFVAGADEVRHRIKSSQKKTITIYENMGASGGMWIFTASDELYATPVTELGSIGVKVAYEEDDEDKTVTIVSKNAMNKDCSLNGDCKEKIQTKIDQTEEMFFEVLFENTGWEQDKLVSLFNNGDTIPAEVAKDAGFIKEVIHFKPLMEKLTTSRVNSALAKIENKNTGESMENTVTEVNTTSNAEVVVENTEVNEQLAQMESKLKAMTTKNAKIVDMQQNFAEILKMGMNHEMSADTLAEMLSADTMNDAKAIMVDNLGDSKAFVSTNDASTPEVQKVTAQQKAAKHGIYIVNKGE